MRSIPSPIVLLAFLVPAVLYSLTLYPGVGGRLDPGFSANLQFVGHVLGVPEAPGYPQYVLVNYLWTLLPFPGSLAVRVNLLSVICALTAAAFFFSTARTVGRSGSAALLALWVVLSCETVWVMATEASIGSLHLVYVSAILFSGTAWLESRHPAWLAAAFLACGLGIGNDTSILTLLPAIAVLAATTQARRFWSWRGALVFLAAGTAGVGQYLLLWWQSHAAAVYLEAVPRNASMLDVVRAMVTVATGPADIFQSGPTNLTLDLLVEGNAQLALPALFVAVWGFTILHDDSPMTARFWGVAWLSQIVYLSTYDAGIWSSRCAPLWLITGLFLAVGLARASRVRDGLSIAAVAAVGVALVWTGADNFSRLRVASSPHDLTRLISSAGPDGVIVTHDRSNYKDDQIRNYYRLGLDMAATGPRLLTASELLRQPNILLSDRPIYYRRRSTAMTTDVVPFSPAGTAASWLAALPEGTLVAVIATDVESADDPIEILQTRRQIGAALAPLGIGEPLRQAQEPLPWYVALAVKESPGSSFERTHPTDAILGLPGEQDALRAWFEAHSDLPGPAFFDLYAGRAREGIYNRLRLDDYDVLSRRPEIRVFAIEATAPFSYSVARFDGTSQGALEPYYFVSGTRTPVRSTVFALSDNGSPRLSFDGRPSLPVSAGDLTVVVVGCREERIKVAMPLTLGDVDRAPRRLLRLARNISADDWLIVATQKPLTNAAAQMINGFFRHRGLPEQEWSAIRANLMLAARASSSPAQVRIYRDVEEPIEIQLPCAVPAAGRS